MDHQDYTVVPSVGHGWVRVGIVSMVGHCQYDETDPDYSASHRVE